MRSTQPWGRRWIDWIGLQIRRSSPPPPNKDNEVKNKLIYRTVSVAKPEPVERQIFVGAGAEVFLARLRSRVY
jgi:hypothetical protein